jgi:hypothetical protein
MFGAMTGRAEAQVMRLACLYALAHRTLEVGREHLMAALEVWRYASESAAYLFGDRLGDPPRTTSSPRSKPSGRMA